MTGPTCAAATSDAGMTGGGDQRRIGAILDVARTIRETASVHA